MEQASQFKTCISLIILGFLAACGRTATTSDPSQIFPEPTAPALAECNSQLIPNKFIVQWENGDISVEHGENREKFIKSFIAPRMGKIKHVEYDQVLKLHSDVPSLAPTALPPATWGQSMINASTAWSRGITGDGVLVAVIDTGVDISHRQVKSRIFQNTKELLGTTGVDDDGNGYIDDINGWNFFSGQPLIGDNQYHGTHVAGVIAADHSGSVLGVAPQAQILPLAFLGPKGNGELSSALKAMEYSISMGAKVVNASWGGGGCSRTMENLIGQMSAKGIFFVAAAGNDSLNLDETSEFPASFGSLGYEGMLVVGASTYLDFLAGFSNFGVNPVHVVAPGDEILSLMPQNKTAYLSGTSMAAPFVSGAVAALFSHPSKPSLQKIRAALLSTVRSGTFRVSTRGRIDVAAAIQYLDSN
jgi:subtilisin family serine protease